MPLKPEQIMVKVFPIQSIGGTRYLQSLKGPLPHIPLIPSGGIDLENAVPLLEAGGYCTGFVSGAISQGTGETAGLVEHFPASEQLTRETGLNFCRPFCESRKGYAHH